MSIDKDDNLRERSIEIEFVAIVVPYEWIRIDDDNQEIGVVYILAILSNNWRDLPSDISFAPLTMDVTVDVQLSWLTRFLVNDSAVANLTLSYQIPAILRLVNYNLWYAPSAYAFNSMGISTRYYIAFLVSEQRSDCFPWITTSTVS